MAPERDVKWAGSIDHVEAPKIPEILAKTDSFYSPWMRSERAKTELRTGHGAWGTEDGGRDRVTVELFVRGETEEEKGRHGASTNNNGEKKNGGFGEIKDFDGSAAIPTTNKKKKTVFEIYFQNFCINGATNC